MKHKRKNMRAQIQEDLLLVLVKVQSFMTEPSLISKRYTKSEKSIIFGFDQ